MIFIITELLVFVPALYKYSTILHKNIKVLNEIFVFLGKLFTGMDRKKLLKRTGFKLGKWLYHIAFNFVTHNENFVHTQKLFINNIVTLSNFF